MQSFKTHQGKIINIELKGEGTAKETLQTCYAVIEGGYIQKDQIVVSSFNHSEILKVRQSDPDIKVACLFSAGFQPKGHRLYPWSQNDFGEYRPFGRLLLNDEIVKAIQPDFFNIEESDLTEGNVNAILDHYPNAKAMVWWLPGREQLPADYAEFWQKLENQLIKGFIYSVISNYPKAMREYLMHRE